MRLRYGNFDDGTSDDGAGGSADRLTLQDDDATSTTSIDTGGDDAPPDDNSPVLSPLPGQEFGAAVMANVPVLSATGNDGLSSNPMPAIAGSFGDAGDPNPLVGGTAGGNGPFIDSRSAGTGFASTSDGPSGSVQTPAASGGLDAGASDSSGQPAPELSGGSGVPTPPAGESASGNMTLPRASSGTGGANGPTVAGTSGETLPLVGDLGVIYQAPTPMRSDSAGSPGSSPASAPSSSSSGFVISVSYDQTESSLPAGFVAAINAVVSYFESIFTAPITVNIDVGYGEIDGQQLQTDALGESETFLANYSYSSVIDALASVDPSAAASLPSSMPVNGTMWIGTAEAKALGLPLEQPSTDIDGFAGFSDVFPFTYDPNNRAVPSEYDFIGVVEHEFTEVMGRIDLFGESIGGTTGYSLLDMFHYTAPGNHTYTGLATNYFSANNGTTNLDYFNSNPEGDLGDWAGSAGADSYLAFTPTDEEDTVSQSDISEMNALGYSSSGQSGTGNSTPPQPANTTADMIMERGTDGTYEIYDIGNNMILAAGELRQISTQWQVVGLGGFDGGGTSDMLMRNGSSGVLEVYDVGNNTITGNASLGTIGLEWSVAGFGDFSGRAGETDMLMRDVGTGQFEVYDIASNQITSAASIGQVGIEWQVLGFGDFSGDAGETDMLMRNTNTGAMELYDIAGNRITKASSIGTIATQWQVAGFGDFSGNANEADMLMRNVSTGQFEIYDIHASQLMSPVAMGQVGLDWTIAGFGDLSGNAGQTDMLMRNSKTGEFEVYDILNNQLTYAAAIGQVGTEWSVAGIAADPGSSPASAQLTQAMASFAPASGSAAADAVLGQPATELRTPSPFATPNQTHPTG